MKNDNNNMQRWMLHVKLLAKIVKEKGISHQEIANRTGMKRSNVSRMFASKICPTLRTFLLVSNAIGLDFFLVDKGKMDMKNQKEA